MQAAPTRRSVSYLNAGSKNPLRLERRLKGNHFYSCLSSSGYHEKVKRLSEPCEIQLRSDLHVDELCNCPVNNAL